MLKLKIFEKKTPSLSLNPPKKYNEINFKFSQNFAKYYYYNSISSNFKENAKYAILYLLTHQNHKKTKKELCSNNDEIFIEQK